MSITNVVGCCGEAFPLNPRTKDMRSPQKDRNARPVV